MSRRIAADAITPHVLGLEWIARRIARVARAVAEMPEADMEHATALRRKCAVASALLEEAHLLLHDAAERSRSASLREVTVPVPSGSDGA